MPDNKLIFVALGVITALSVGFLIAWIWPSANNEQFPQGLDYLCPSGHGFNMTVRQMEQFYKDHYGEPLPCPTCKASPCQRAVRDAATGKYRLLDRNEGSLPVPGMTPIETPPPPVR